MKFIDYKLFVNFKVGDFGGQAVIEFAVTLLTSMIATALTFFLFFSFYTSLVLNHYAYETNFCIVEGRNTLECARSTRHKVTHLLFMSEDKIKVFTFKNFNKIKTKITVEFSFLSSFIATHIFEKEKTLETN